MHPVVRALGKVLRLVGVSSPEDAAARQETPGGPPSWRTDRARRPAGEAPPMTAPEVDSEQKPR